MLRMPKPSLFKEYKMKKFLLFIALLFPVMASAQQLPASGGRTQGMPDGYGDLVQINCKTGCSASGPSSTQLPATLGPKTGALSLSVVPNTDTTFPVSAASLPLPTGAATSALQTTTNTTLGAPFQAGGSIGNTTFAATQATASNFNAQVVGPVATGVAASGNPLPGGCKAHGSGLTVVTNNQRQDIWCGTSGQTIVALGNPVSIAPISAGGSAVTLSFTASGGQNPLGVLPYVWNATSGLAPFSGDANGTNTQLAVTASRWQYAAASGGISNSTTAVTVCPAQGGTLRCYMTSLQLDATALGAATEIVVRDGASGTVIWRGAISTAGVSNDNIVFPVPLKGTANTLMEVATITATITGAVYVNSQGFSGN